MEEKNSSLDVLFKKMDRWTRLRTQIDCRQTNQEFCLRCFQLEMCGDSKGRVKEIVGFMNLKLRREHECEYTHSEIFHRQTIFRTKTQ